MSLDGGEISESSIAQPLGYAENDLRDAALPRVVGFTLIVMGLAGLSRTAIQASLVYSWRGEIGSPASLAFVAASLLLTVTEVAAGFELTHRRRWAAVLAACCMWALLGFEILPTLQRLFGLTAGSRNWWRSFDDLGLVSVEVCDVIQRCSYPVLVLLLLRTRTLRNSLRS